MLCSRVPTYSRRLFQSDSSYSQAISLPHHYLSCLFHSGIEDRLRAYTGQSSYSVVWFQCSIAGAWAIPGTCGKGSLAASSKLSCLSTYISAGWWGESTKIGMSGWWYMRDFFNVRFKKKQNEWDKKEKDEWPTDGSLFNNLLFKIIYILYKGNIYYIHNICI